MKDHGRRLVSALLALLSGSTVVGATVASTGAKAEQPRVTACSIMTHRILA